jgi:hypothetical protein
MKREAIPAILSILLAAAAPLLLPACGDDGSPGVDGAEDLDAAAEGRDLDGGTQDETLPDPVEADVAQDPPADPADGETVVPPPPKCFVGYSEYGIVTYDNSYAQYQAFIDALASRGLNLVRTWAYGYSNWEYQNVDNCGPDWFETMPFRRSGEGGKYDLKDYNPDFFERLRSFVSYARGKGVYIEVTLFDSWGLKSIGEWGWNPWDDDYNVNGRVAETGPCEVHERFFDLGDAVMVDIEKSFVQKIVSETMEFDNVLFEIMNEPLVCPTESVITKATAWHAEVIRWIREIRPGALISIVAGPPPDTLLALPDYEFVCPHYGAWGDSSGTTWIPDMLSAMQPSGKHIIVDDDGCYHRDAEGNAIRKFPDNQRLWANDAVDHGGSYNHLQDDLYCHYFYLPSEEMLDALGSAAAKCAE